jgi:hypothetical protein
VLIVGSTKDDKYLPTIHIGSATADTQKSARASVALVIGTFGNIMILLVAGYERGLNKVGKQFMVNLALADFCVSAVADPMCIVGKYLSSFVDPTMITCTAYCYIDHFKVQ